MTKMKPFLQKRNGVWYIWGDKRESFYDVPEALGATVKEACEDYLEYISDEQCKGYVQNDT